MSGHSSTLWSSLGVSGWPRGGVRPGACLVSSCTGFLSPGCDQMHLELVWGQRLPAQGGCPVSRQPPLGSQKKSSGSSLRSPSRSSAEESGCEETLTATEFHRTQIWSLPTPLEGLAPLGLYAQAHGSETAMVGLALSPYKHVHSKRQDTIPGPFQQERGIPHTSVASFLSVQ